MELVRACKQKSILLLAANLALYLRVFSVAGAVGWPLRDDAAQRADS